MDIDFLLDWYKKNARPFPWRTTHDAYKIWVSEVFLQQTQASRVVSFYSRMIEKFPTVQHLAKSNWEEFFPYFKGLGFYSRGKNMLKCSREIVEKYNGKFPENPQMLEKLSGIGDYTAHAIVSFAYKKNVPALDVNLYRVFGRMWNLEKKKKEIRQKAFEIYAKHSNAYVLNHALMDIGSSFCTAKKVECTKCPLQKNCEFFKAKKKVIVSKKKNTTLSRKQADEISVLVLQHNKKYLLQKKQTGTDEECWGFPLFLRTRKQENNVLPNHRHFLQNIAQKKWRIEISVRPPFYIQELSEKIFELPLARFRFSRCQIQSGEFCETEEFQFFSWAEIQNLQLETLYEEVFLHKLEKMRMV